jgi:hypothetical protein
MKSVQDRRQQYHARAADGWVGQGSWSEARKGTFLRP